MKPRVTSNPTSLIFTMVGGLIALTYFTFNIHKFSLEALNGVDPYDFPNYYFSGIRLFEQRPIYDLLTQELMSSLGWVYNAYMADPPFTVVLLSPLALMDYSSAWLIFLALSIFSIVIGIIFLLRDLRFKSPQIFLLTSIVLASQSSLYLFKRNHIESLIFLGLCLCIINLRHQRYQLASLLIGCVSAIKLFPAFLLVMMIQKLGRRYVAAGFLLMATLSLVGITICDYGDLAFSNSRRYLDEVLGRSEQWLGTVGNFSLRSFLVAFGDDPHSISSSYVALLILVVATAFRTAISKTSSLSTCLLTGTASALLLSPLAWLNYLVLLVPGALYFYDQHHGSDPQRANRVALLVGLTIYWPTYIDAGQSEITKLISLFPTIILLWLVAEPLVHGMNFPASTLVNKFIPRFTR